MNITRHAFERAEQRVSWDKETTERMAAKALQFGVRHQDVSGSLNRYITKLYFGKSHPDNVRIYGEHVYLFKLDTLITVILLPRKYRNAVRRNQNP